MPEAAPMKSHQRVCSSVNGIRVTPGKMPHGMWQTHQLYTKTYRQPRKSGHGIFGFPRETHTNWLYTVKWSALKTYILVTYGLNKLYLGIDMYINICMKIMKKETMNLKASGKGREKCNYNL